MFGLDLKPCCSLDLSAKDQRKMVKMAHALGNPIRFEIIKFLLTHPGCINGDIVEALPIAQSTTSQHLRVLKEAGWVRGKSEGNKTNYCLSPEGMGWFCSVVGEIFPKGED